MKGTSGSSVGLGLVVKQELQQLKVGFPGCSQVRGLLNGSQEPGMNLSMTVGRMRVS